MRILFNFAMGAACLLVFFLADLILGSSEYPQG